MATYLPWIDIPLCSQQWPMNQECTMLENVTEEGNANKNICCSVRENLQILGAEQLNTFLDQFHIVLPMAMLALVSKVGLIEASP